MTQKTRPPKNSHTAKSNPEKQFYGDLLNRPTKEIDDTFSADTSESKISETQKITDFKNTKDIEPKTENKNKKKKPYKSFGTQVSEDIKSIIFGVIVLGVVGICVTVVWQQQRELGEISATLKSLQKDIDSIQGKYQISNNDKFDLVRFTTEVNKDLEFIKTRLQKVESRIGL